MPKVSCRNKIFIRRQKDNFFVRVPRPTLLSTQNFELGKNHIISPINTESCVCQFFQCFITIVTVLGFTKTMSYHNICEWIWKLKIEIKIKLTDRPWKNVHLGREPRNFFCIASWKTSDVSRMIKIQNISEKHHLILCSTFIHKIICARTFLFSTQINGLRINVLTTLTGGGCQLPVCKTLENLLNWV